MIDIHTVAAGGGSILHFDGSRMRVGPDSAGADPGPACYGNGGPLAITDCNVLLGKLRPDHFPHVFGADGAQPLDAQIVRERFATLAEEISRSTGTPQSPESIAEGFLAIAVENMANAIKKISVQRGHDVTDYTLACFGGAGGQHACLVADRLGIERVLIHPHAGVLSALGIGLADVRHVNEEAVESTLAQPRLDELQERWDELGARGTAAVQAQGVPAEQIRAVRRLALRYAGSDTSMHVAAGPVVDVIAAFESLHRARFGFISPEKDLIIESIQVETIGADETIETTSEATIDTRDESIEHPTTMAGLAFMLSLIHI